tara:strand:- start:6015 stop:6272 length:258 start_codon:yes stop_codon:yes gene_type:complete
MAMVKKSITVTDHQDKWIQSQMKTGNYGTDSELIREALREKQNRDTEVEYIQSKLIAAEKSGFIDKGRDEILAGFKDRLRANGEL